MLTAVVNLHVKEECVEMFKKASLANAKASREELGVKGFELLQQQDDETRFLLVETYYTPDDQLKHRETEHYKLWRSTVEECFTQPRTNVKYTVVEG